MSHTATSWASNLEGLPAGAKLVLLLLSECHNGKTGQCNPGHDWLCRKTGYKTRMLARHLSDLEARGLIKRDTVSLGRARGKQTSFTLKIGVQNTDLQVHHNTPVLECTCNAVPLEPHSSTCALYKEEPEGTGIDNVASAFNDVWSAWSPKGRKRSKSKANCLNAFKRQVAKSDVDTVRKAALMYAKSTDSEYHKALNSWLSGGMWENWTGQDMSQPDPESQPLENWQAAARDYCENHIWDRHKFGPAPHEPGCKAPAGLLTTISKRMANHRWADRIKSGVAA